MTQPVGFNPSLNYTPYDPNAELSQTEARNSSNGGAEGAGGTPNTPPASQDVQDCTTEAMKTAAACGAAYLASKVFTPLGLLGVLNCAANATELLECLTEPESKPQGQ